jgi:hypothetical protein
MAVALRQSKRFDASSPVTRYWLANCVGFSLAGGARGTVEGILADDDPHEASVLEVRTSRRRTRRVPASSVVAVVPSEQLLIVDRRRRAMRDRRRDLSVRLRWAARAATHGLALASRLLLALATQILRLSKRAWDSGSPAVVRAGRRGGTEAARLVRSVPWQSYGRSALSATTRLSQARSRRSSRPRTTSSDRSSGKSSSDEAPTTSST